MGKHWDSPGGPAAYQALAKQWGEAMLSVLHPGAVVFLFGGTRTWHRLACGIQDAGFQMFDTIMWIRSQGFPKARDIGGMIAKATGEKPIAEVPNPAFTFQKNSGQTSTGWEGVIPETKKVFANPWQGYKTPALKPAHEPILCLRAPRQGMIYAELARRHGAGALNVDAARIGGGAKMWDKPKGGIWHPSEPGEQRFIDNPLGRYPTNVIFDEESAPLLDEQSGDGNAHTDEGGASRYFFVAKASRKERNAGCDDLQNDHPCVKPVALTRYLATLLLPPTSVAPRRILVPFAGSGSEMIGAKQAGWEVVAGVEQHEPYCEIARRRLKALADCVGRRAVGKTDGIPPETTTHNLKNGSDGSTKSSNPILTACTGTNAGVLPKVLRLYVPEGSVIADVTYGKGAFWKNIDTTQYDLRPTDLMTGVDFRQLPYISTRASMH